MRAMIEKLLKGLLDKFPSRWKSVTGLALLVALGVAGNLGYLDSETIAAWTPWVTALFGVGVYHKIANKVERPHV